MTNAIPFNDLRRAVWADGEIMAAVLLSMFLAGLTGYVMLGAPGGVEGDFLVYGYIAMTPVAAIGLIDLWAMFRSM